MNLFSVDPIRKFVTNKAGAVETCTRGSTRVVGSVANDQQIIAAVTGKSIAIVGAVLHSAGAAGVVFDAGSGGSAIWSLQLEAAKTFLLPVLETGFYFETGAGVGLYADVTTASTAINLVFITYTP